MDFEKTTYATTASTVDDDENLAFELDGEEYETCDVERQCVEMDVHNHDMFEDYNTRRSMLRYDVIPSDLRTSGDTGKMIDMLRAMLSINDDGIKRELYHVHLDFSSLHLINKDFHFLRPTYENDIGIVRPFAEDKHAKDVYSVKILDDDVRSNGMKQPTRSRLSITRFSRASAMRMEAFPSP